ncbi:MAG: T9SS type A sorting domain-containing protein [Candidatus Cloacimonadaceae bacterium]|nr:T9SS type A sorting domain-containing protein [Candidatus Cloacimonadaceae bacterium]
MKTRILLLLVLILAVGLAWGQSNGDYRSFATGNWSTRTNWQRYYDPDPQAGAAGWKEYHATNYPFSAPTSANGVITIREGHTITQNSASRTIDQVNVYGTLEIGASTATTIADGSGVDLTIHSGGTMITRSNLTVNGSVVIDGSILDTGSTQLTGPGDVTLSSGAKLDTKHANGIRNEIYNEDDDEYIYFGYIVVTGSVSLSSNAEYVFSNKNGNQDSYGLPAHAKKVTVDVGSYTFFIRTAVEITDRFVFATGTTNSESIALTYSQGATLEYAGTSAQSTCPKCFPATNGPTNLVISNTHADGVTLWGTDGNRTLNGTLTMTSAAKVLDLNGQTLTVNGMTTINGGSIDRDGGTFKTDGYSEPSKFISILESNQDPNEYLTNVSVSTTVNESSAGIVKREWTVSGASAGTKEFEFTWTAEDDGNENWGSVYPILTFNSTSMDHVSFTAGPPRVLRTEVSTYSTGTYAVDHSDAETLPVELASFSAILIAQNRIRLDWLTHSETGVRGFYVLRQTENELANALVVSPLISATNTSNQMAYTFEDSDFPGDGTYYYWLQVEDMDGGGQYFGPSMITVGNGGGDVPPPPLVTQIRSAYPNPFNPNLNIAYDIAQPSLVNIEVYNLKGQLVKTLINTQKQPGLYSTTWFGDDEQGQKIGTGVYFVRMKAGKYETTRKVTMVK